MSNTASTLFFDKDGNEYTPLTVDGIKLMVREAARIREESYDRAAYEEWDKAHTEKIARHVPNFYRKTLQQACLEVSPELGGLIYLALDGWWNNTLDWAKP